ncbi:MAG: Nif3-like dinuclear metal center hexameric protein [Luteolibacter sp.]
MIELRRLAEYLDEELKIASITDYPGAVNGLQLENRGQVARIVAAVDASLSVVEEAAKGEPAFLLVHHGLFWQGARPIRAGLYRKLKTALDAELAIYSAHLPLDFHPIWGNNVLLAQAIGLENMRPFLESKGVAMGLCGEWHGTRDELASRIGQAVGGKVHVCPGGKDRIETVGLVTGGAGSEVAKVAATRVDAFVTGEGPHWSYPLAEELGLNVFYAGHYATETFGVKALAEELSSRFGLPWSFIDRPTGL